jgi:Arc/MetJ-type ribon-helix-helix transcriptional regulator
MSEIPLEGSEVPLEEVQALSALEKALTEALATVPLEHVLFRVVATFPKAPINIDSGQLSRFHGHVQKVSVSMPEDLATAVRERTGPGGFSRYVTEAVEEKLRLDRIDDLSAYLEAKYGPVPEELIQEAMREWPDYEEYEEEYDSGEE